MPASKSTPTRLSARSTRVSRAQFDRFLRRVLDPRARLPEQPDLQAYLALEKATDAIAGGLVGEEERGAIKLSIVTIVRAQLSSRKALGR